MSSASTYFFPLLSVETAKTAFGRLFWDRESIYTDQGEICEMDEWSVLDGLTPSNLASHFAV
jgi:hypothetical protein